MNSSDVAADDAPLCLPPRPLGRRRAAALPAGTVDTHFHVFANEAPLVLPRNYTPQIITLADWTAYGDALGIARGVVVQPSVYGFDNRVLLDALSFAQGRLRGVVVISPDVPDEDLNRMHALGVRGVRINTRNKAGVAFGAAESLMARIASLGWTAQFQVSPSQFPDIAALVPRFAVPVVIDHLGFIDAGAADQVHALQRLLDAGEVYVKASAPYRLDRSEGFREFGHAVGRLAHSHADRLLWASDWPHTELWADMPDDGELVERALSWLPDQATCDLAFAGNAQRLFWAER